MLMEVLQDEKKNGESFCEYRNSFTMDFLRVSLTLIDNGKPLGSLPLFLSVAFSIICHLSLHTPPPETYRYIPPLFAFCTSQNNFIQSHLLYKSFFKQSLILPMWSCSVSKSPYSSFFTTLTDSLQFQLTFFSTASISPHSCMNAV